MKTSLIRKIFVIISLLTCQQMIAHDFEVNGIYYGLSIFNKNTAYVTHKGVYYGEFDEYSGSIVIPESVTYNGKTYKVQSIGGYAFSGCTGLTSVTLPNSIVEIHKNAFEQSSLETIIIPETVKTIHNHAFASCYNLKCVELKHTTPPAYNDLFAGINIDQIRIKVPFSSYYTYKGTEGWNTLTLANYNVNGIYYSPINQNEVKVTYRNILDSGNTYYNSYSGNVTIPADVTIDGYKCTVSAIEEYAFYESTELKSVTINDIIESIPECAFTSCTNLTSVKIGNNVKRIEGSAFHDCHSLDNVVIPDNVTYIGGFSFCDCGAMKNLTLGVKVSNIAGYAFYDCTGLTNISILNPTPPTCESNVFYNVNTTNISLSVPYGSVSTYKSTDTWKDFKYEQTEEEPSENPEACYLVGNYNGWNTPTEENVDELYTLTDPDKDGVYYGKFYFDKGQFSFKIFITIGGWESGNFFGADREITMDNITDSFSVSYAGNAYNFECSDWTGGYVEIFFDFNNSTIRFVIPKESPILTYNILNSTNVEVVAGTEKYTGDIVIPSTTVIDGNTYNVTQIGEESFLNCTGLTSVTIPNSVTTIGYYAFRGCSGLTSITIPNSVTSIGTNPFTGCNNLSLIVVESGNTVYDSRDNCNAIIETSTNTLITGCKNTIIPNSVTGIGKSAFDGCTGLTSITIPNSVTSIGTWAFYRCTGLTSVTIGNSVTGIGVFAFYGCSGLTSITIPNSVTSIGSNPFAGCNNLSSIVVESGNTVYDSRDNCNAIIETTTNTLISGCKNTIIPNSVTGIGEYAFYYCTGLTSVTIPNSVTSIGSSAFYYCTGLTSITIGNSVTGIGDYAFAYCSGLTSITSLNPTPPTCGTGVFSGVNVANIPLTVPSGSESQYQTADVWKDFGTITAYSSASRSESSGIDDIFAGDGEVEYYNLQGVRVMNPERGLYIKRQGGKTTKIKL